MLPKVAGQSCSGAGVAVGEPACSDARQASTAGQSAALLTSFHTAAPIEGSAGLMAELRIAQHEAQGSIGGIKSRWGRA
jgi:hypothetical protein